MRLNNNNNNSNKRVKIKYAVCLSQKGKQQSFIQFLFFCLLKGYLKMPERQTPVFTNIE